MESFGLVFLFRTIGRHFAGILHIRANLMSSSEIRIVKKDNQSEINIQTTRALPILVTFMHQESPSNVTCSI